jgi:6-pyruvoyltetrahydropterin/6-carboxytetrahydropterin synthase
MYLGRIEHAFDAGHRIVGHGGKCASPHGHTYKAEVFVDADELDELGFVADFGDVKAPIRRWIDDHWDHAFLVNEYDTDMLDALGRVPESKIFHVRGGNPSAERLARVLFEVAESVLPYRLHSVRIWESPTSYAEYAAAQVGFDRRDRASELGVRA